MPYVTVHYHRELDGRCPYADWLDKLRDATTRAKIMLQVHRLIAGKFGNVKSIGGNVRELRVDYGPGYRVYFGILQANEYLVLCGGDKSTQSRDIERAKSYWQARTINAI